MLLSDRDIIHAIEDHFIDVTPFDESLLQPASIDVRLHPVVRRPEFRVRHIDVAAVPEGHTNEVPPRADGTITIAPGQFILACTEEIITLGPLHAARFEGKSSLARLGIAVHVTGGFIDPGFSGQVTLEIANLAPWTVTLRAGMRIGQLAFHHLSSTPREMYSVKGHYNGQMGPTESRYQLDFPLAPEQLPARLP